MKKYVKDDSLQIAMTEYNKLNSVNDEVWTKDDQYIGIVSKIYDNTSRSGEQVYAVVDNSSIPAEDVKEVTVLFRGSTSPQEILKEPVDVLLDWGANGNE